MRRLVKKTTNNFSAQNMKIIPITKDVEFYSLESSWNRLLKSSANDNPFLTWDWLYTWWSFYKDGKELSILLVKEEAEIVAIAPLYLCTQRIMGVPVRCLRIIGDEEVCSEYLDIIVEQNKEEVYSFLFDYLIRGPLSWDVLFFSDFLKDSNFMPLLSQLNTQKVFKRIIRDVTTNPYVILPKTWDIYFSSLKKKTRKNIGQNLNRLNKTFDWRFNPYPEACNITLEQAMTEMMRLHEQRWKTKRHYGVFQRKRFRSFHLKLADRFYSRKWLRLFFLWIDQNAVAALYGYEYGGKFYAYQMGFDTEMNKYGVGSTVLLLSIRDSIEEGLQEYDFLRGESAYKFGLTDHQRNNISVHVTRNTFKGKLAHFYHLNKPVFKAWTKSKMPDKIWKHVSDIKYKRIMKD